MIVLSWNQHDRNVKMMQMILARLFNGLGFTIKEGKSQLIAKKELTFLGFDLNAAKMTASLTAEKKEKFFTVVDTVLLHTMVKIREVAGLIGLMVAYIAGVDCRSKQESA